MVGNLTLKQLRIYLMKTEGIDGVEYMHRRNHINPGMKKDPKRKFIEPANARAVENLKRGMRWEV